MPLPTTDWLAALADMDAAIAAATAGLTADEPTPAAPAGADPLADLEARLTGWDERLVAAGRLAEDLERGFAAQAAAVGRWTEAFTAWRDRLQQPAGPPS